MCWAIRKRSFSACNYRPAASKGRRIDLITECGIKPGMHVLDFGTGAGDVALLVAQTVGPSGAVVGVDQEERSVRLSERRAAAGGLLNATFAVGGDDSLAQHGCSTRQSDDWCSSTSLTRERRSAA